MNIWYGYVFISEHGSKARRRRRTASSVARKLLYILLSELGNVLGFDI